MAYFPNGTAGMVLDEQCWECPYGQLPCPIVIVQTMYNYKQLDDGNSDLREAMNFLVNDNGECKMLKLLDGVEHKELPA